MKTAIRNMPKNLKFGIHSACNRFKYVCYLIYHKKKSVRLLLKWSIDTDENTTGVVWNDERSNSHE